MIEQILQFDHSDELNELVYYMKLEALWVLVNLLSDNDSGKVRRVLKLLPEEK